MEQRPVKDCYDLIEKSVSHHMRPYIEASMHEDERLYQKMDRIEMVLIKNNAARERMMQWAAIIILFGLFMATLSSCLH